jgi:hypothetical protein
LAHVNVPESDAGRPWSRPARTKWLHWVLLAHGVLLAGLIADRIFFHAARLLDFKAELAVVVAFLLVVVLAPVLLVSPHLRIGEAPPQWWHPDSLGATPLARAALTDSAPD